MIFIRKKKDKTHAKDGWYNGDTFVGEEQMVNEHADSLSIVGMVNGVVVVASSVAPVGMLGLFKSGKLFSVIVGGQKE